MMLFVPQRKGEKIWGLLDDTSNSPREYFRYPFWKIKNWPKDKEILSKENAGHPSFLVVHQNMMTGFYSSTHTHTIDQFVIWNKLINSLPVIFKNMRLNWNHAVQIPLAITILCNTHNHYKCCRMPSSKLQTTQQAVVKSLCCSGVWKGRLRGLLMPVQ